MGTGGWRVKSTPGGARIQTHTRVQDPPSLLTWGAAAPLCPVHSHQDLTLGPPKASPVLGVTGPILAELSGFSSESPASPIPASEVTFSQAREDSRRVGEARSLSSQRIVTAPGGSSSFPLSLTVSSWTLLGLLSSALLVKGPAWLSPRETPRMPRGHLHPQRVPKSTGLCFAAHTSMIKVMH